MIKAIACFKRRAGMDVESFQDYWLNRHSEVVCKLPGIKRYTQSHTLLGGYRKGEPVYDGVAEVWFENLAAMQALPGTEPHNNLLHDEAQFIEGSSMGILLTSEHVIKDAGLPESYVKNIEFVTAKPGMSLEAFQRHWRHVHGPLGAKIPSILRYVQSHSRRGGYANGRRPLYDGAAITWFESVDAVRSGATSAAYRRTREDESNFMGEDLELS